MIEIQTKPCLGCGLTAWFTMTEEQQRFLQQGVHVQTVFPNWSPEDREMLISGTCPDCWEEMWAEEEDEDWYPETDEGINEIPIGDLDPFSDFPEYERDWYVD